MRNIKIKSLIAISFVYLLIMPSLLHGQSNFQTIGYLPQRSVEKMTPQHFKLISQAIYFGMDADEEGNILVEECKKDLDYLNSIRKDTHCGISVCFGGWERSDFFIKMTASKESRQNFCDQVLDLCQNYNLNGVDIDWEYPKTKKQRKNFKKLIQDLYKTLNPHGLDISIAVGHWQAKIDLTASVEPWLSYVNLMLYDNVDPIRGHASFHLVEKASKDFIENGIPAEKLMVGVPFYGRNKINRYKTKSYREVLQSGAEMDDDGWYEHYFFNPPKILEQKVDFIKEKKLGGIMIWELGHDVDPTDPNSLLKSIHKRFEDPQ